jgi:hypothetical protein
MSPEEISMRKVRFTEHQIIAVLKSVETGRTVRMSAVKPVSMKPRITAGKQKLARVLGKSEYVLRLSA